MLSLRQTTQTLSLNNLQAGLQAAGAAPSMHTVIESHAGWLEDLLNQIRHDGPSL